MTTREGGEARREGGEGLRVALVHDWLTGMRGGEKVLEALGELWPAAPIHTLIHVPGSVSEALESHPIRTSFLQRLPWIERRYRAFLPLFPAAIEDFDLTDYDLVVSTSHCVAKGVIPGPGAFHLCYCHTPMRYAWDQEHTYFPRRRGLGARLRNLVLTALRAWDAASVPRVDLFVANSRFVAERIRRYYGREAVVLPPPVDVELFSRVESIAGQHNIEPDPARVSDPDREDGCLMVSALAPYKRVDLAIAACERAGLALTVVGIGPERRRLARLAGPRTRFLGRVEGGELAELYRRAAFFLQPGVEDFGIASVEALASGTPVVARGRGGILDIVDDGVHGVLYDGDDAASLGRAIDKARQIRFNRGNLEDRAHAFSKARFTGRLRSLLSRYVPIGNPGADTPSRRLDPSTCGTHSEAVHT